MNGNMNIEKDKNLLESIPELKKMPYSVPEGYFESAMDRAKEIPGKSASRVWQKLYPLASMAAMFAIIATVGTLILNRGEFFSEPSEQMQMEDYLVHSGYDFTVSDYQGENSQLADAEISSEDIVQYLIYTGLSIEDMGE